MGVPDSGFSGHVRPHGRARGLDDGDDLGRALSASDLSDVVGDDGRDDAAERAADHSHLSPGCEERCDDPFALPAHVCIRDWIYSGVARIQRRCNAAAVGPGRGGPAIAHDDERQPVAGRHDPDRGGHLSMDAAQACLPATLSLAVVFSHGALAAGHARRTATRPASRPLLRRLLLGPDASAVRRRRDESAVDRRDYRFRAAGKTRARRRSRRAVEWTGAGARGDVGAAVVARLTSTPGDAARDVCNR